MAGFSRRIVASLRLGAVLMLAGCVSGGGDALKGADPIAGGPIEVSALGPPPGGTAAARAEAKAALPEPAAQKPPEAGAKAQTPGEAEPVPAAPDAAAPMPAAPAAASAVPEALKTEAQRACEKRKGIWSKAANGLHSCVQYTKDSQKRCTRSSDCEGQCLARSGTCAPFTPLLGCNEVLDDIGRAMTQCLD